MHIAFLMLGIFALLLLISAMVFNAGVFYYDHREQREEAAYMEGMDDAEVP